MESLAKDGKAALDVADESIELGPDDVEVRLLANEGWAAAQGTEAVVILSTELTPELIRAGLTRDVVRLVQDYRKELDLERTDRIELIVVSDSDELKQAIEENRDYLCRETLTETLSLTAVDGVTLVDREIGDYKIQLGIRVIAERG